MRCLIESVFFRDGKQILQRPRQLCVTAGSSKFGLVIYLLLNPLGPLTTWAHILVIVLFNWLYSKQMMQGTPNMYNKEDEFL